MLELRDTVTDMLSTIYTDRFRAEYNQLKIRFDKLKAMIEKWDKGVLVSFILVNLMLCMIILLFLKKELFLKKLIYNE